MGADSIYIQSRQRPDNVPQNESGLQVFQDQVATATDPVNGYIRKWVALLDKSSVFSVLSLIAHNYMTFSTFSDAVRFTRKFHYISDFTPAAFKWGQRMINAVLWDKRYDFI
ncbi:hypothetical protein GGR95_002524 [Sulfitobacter undariae]|uniref:Uncharacterized protein n=1 Tax=Sulfitobacter undariae TaxID=1563671 RepID=A0A7W6EA71_9RHOB|nr:hypothetical protein [Sulfitobacter undariae]MBB3994875.1 hypothetical protein [Sulfitobacter undariae]